MAQDTDPAVKGHTFARVRSVAARLTTPLLPDDYLHLLNPLWTARELRGKVIKVEPETEQAATLVIRPGWGWSFDYQPGQYVGIGVDVDGRWNWRSYSLTSPPKSDQGHIAITVKAMPEGYLSKHLVSGLEPGTIVRLALPQGNFVLPDPPPAKLLFLTGGSGITPVMAILRTLDRRNTLPDVVMVHSAPTSGDVLFRSELHTLAGKYRSMRLHEQHTDSQGMLKLENLADICPDWAERQTWACGPAPMLDAAEKFWKNAGIEQRLHLERFTLDRGEGGEGGTITFTKSGKTMEVDGATTVLEAGEEAGIQMPFGCRMGICHTCVLPLETGKVRDLRNGNEHVEEEKIQTCVSVAAGNCTIDM